MRFLFYRFGFSRFSYLADVRPFVRFTNAFRRLDSDSERSLVFSFYFIFGQGPIRDYFYRRLAPDLQTLVTF